MKKNYFKTLFYTAFLFLSLCCSTEEPAPAPTPAPTPPANTDVTATIDYLSTTSFKLTFNVAVSGLVATEISIDKEVTITSLTAADEENKIFTVVTSALTAETTYTVTLAKTGYTLSTPLTFTTPKPDDVVVGASATNITTAGFTLTFDKAVEGFVASDMELTPAATIAGVTASGTENKVFIVAVPLTDNSTYTVKINKKGFSFNPQPFTITVARVAKDVTATLSNPSNLGFTLTFDTAIPEGLSKEDIKLSPSGTVSSVAADSSNMVFTVVTSELTKGTTFTVTLTKEYYNFKNQPTFTIPLSTAADLTSLKVGTELFALQIPAAGATTTLANAPRTLHIVAGTLPVVAEVSAGARLTAPTSLTSVDFSAGKTVTFTVTAEDGTTVKSYKFVITAYNATTNPYGVYSPRHLSNVRKAVAATDNYKLMNDIFLPNTAGYDDATDPAGMGITDYSTAGWDPIWDGTSNFLGTFDGNGKAIFGLSISRPATDYVGLFRATGSGTVIKNLGVATAGSVKGNNWVGIIAGLNAGGSVISYSYTKGAVSAATTGCGGITGENYGSILNTYSTATVSASTFRCGGIVGSGRGGVVKNCYSTGAAIGNDSIGGIVGFNEASVATCYSTCNVECPQKKGGLVGFNFGAVSNSFWDVETSEVATSDGGGTGKLSIDMKVANPYDDTWTAENWTFTAGKYPKLVNVGGQ